MSARDSFTIEGDGDVRSIVGRGFYLAFNRFGDRWTHAIGFGWTPEGNREHVARGVEWDAERDDPAGVVSPVFQDLRFQVDAGGMPQALLLGMSGRHHFSATFEVASTDGVETLSVDVADRCRETGISAVASTYTVTLPLGELAAADEPVIAWDLWRQRIAFRAGPATRVALAEAGPGATRVQATAEIGLGVPTRRWQYSWSLSRSTP